MLRSRRRALWLFIVGALLLNACGMREASSAAEDVTFDASASTHSLGAPELDMPVGEAGYLGGGAAMGARAPSRSKTDLDSVPREEEAGAMERAGVAPAHPFDDEIAGNARRPLLIYQADLGMAVFRVQENLDAIEKMALDAGGYLVTRSEQRITVRVPVKDFEFTVDAVLKLGDVHRREIVAQDVTAEYLDIQIRLKNALAMRLRLEELLQKAQDVKEALKVEEQLGRVAEQIEVMKGRLKYLREVTSFSTISVEFVERSAPIDARVKLPYGWLRELGLNSLLRL